jgi:predicted RNA-binding Zn ribbon-like protein
MAVIEHVGNALCLDFANTVNVSSAPNRDWLSTADGLHAWAASAGRPLTGGDGAAAVPLATMRAVRDAIHHVFSPIAGGGSPEAAALDLLVGTHAEGIQQARLVAGDSGYTWSWPGRRTRAVLLWEVAASAIDLLGRGPLDRIGECPACGWVFLDTSKNRSRRWCSMATCGGREKAQRYYARHTAARAEP